MFYKLTVKRGNNLKLLAIQYKGGVCKKCGYSKSLAAMDFHHVETRQKDFSISHLKVQFLNESIKEELNKCVLLCCRCHREVHDGTTKLLTNF